ncbi:MAG: hypothetical protein JJT93_01015 [Gammaproteobacteria bacterium]|nr:hypothetical protein [Gammaproteobacteria bacterium]
MTPRLIIHAGAGLRERTRASAEEIDARLSNILAAAWGVVLAEGSLVADQTPGVQTLYAARCGDRTRSFLQVPVLHWPASTRA